MKIEDQIYDTLSKQKFADWYNDGVFTAHICGDKSCLTKAEIVGDIRKLFKLPDDNWIPISQIPPVELHSGKGKMVPFLVACEKYYETPQIGFFYGEQPGEFRVNGSNCGGNVTHWMPLPELPIKA